MCVQLDATFGDVGSMPTAPCFQIRHTVGLPAMCRVMQMFLRLAQSFCAWTLIMVKHSFSARGGLRKWARAITMPTLFAKPVLAGMNKVLTWRCSTNKTTQRRHCTTWRLSVVTRGAVYSLSSWTARTMPCSSDVAAMGPGVPLSCPGFHQIPDKRDWRSSLSLSGPSGC